MNKKTVKSIMVVMILMVVALYFVSGTYARYTSDFKGTATLGVAKWAVKVGSVESGEAEQTFTPEFEYETNDYVADNKIAPNRSASANIEIDLTGTEVAVDAVATVDLSELKSQIGTSEITATAKIDGVEGDLTSGVTIPLVNKSAFIEDNGKKNLKVTVTWDNATDSHSADDTKNGKSLSELTIPVKVTLKQHIEAE